MKRIAKANGIVEATLWRDMLEANGIEATVQRFFLQGSVGEVPPHEAALEIWVQHDEQFERAKAFVEDLRRAPQRQWFCSNCNEKIEGGFEQCWNCGALMPHA